MPAVKAHIADCEDPIQEGSTVTAICGESVPNCKFVMMWDNDFGPVNYSISRGLICQKCQKVAANKRYFYLTVNAQELKHGEG